MCYTEFIAIWKGIYMSEKKFITAWGNATSIAEYRPEQYAKNLTLRYPVKLFLSGTAIRIRLDNFCGTENVTVSSANFAVSCGKDHIHTETLKALTFDGKTSITIPAGKSVLSDTLPYSIEAGKQYAISLYFSDYTQMRSGIVITGPLSGGYFAIGNQTDSPLLDPNLSKPINHYYFLTDIEVQTDATCKTLICYGDSITAQAWPDYLMERAFSLTKGKRAIIRRAACGTRILRQYDNITYASYGLKGEIRFPREIEAQNADAVLIQHGINDIIHPVGTDVNPFRPWSDLPSADELINGLRHYIEIAHQHDLSVYLGTLLPIEGWRTYAPFREDLRCAVNEWICTTDEADGFVDFAAALSDPSHPSSFANGFDSGDHLHPSTAAYQRMAEIIPKDWLDI